jgi:hypothetical protein
MKEEEKQREKERGVALGGVFFSSCSAEAWVVFPHSPKSPIMFLARERRLKGYVKSCWNNVRID